MKVNVHFVFFMKGVHVYPGYKKYGLGMKHFHVFRVLVSIREYKPREIEFIELRQQVQATIRLRRLKGAVLDFEEMSCEEIALGIAQIVAKWLKQKKLKFRSMFVIVDETDEAGGAVVELTKKEVEKLAEQEDIL